MPQVTARSAPGRGFTQHRPPHEKEELIAFAFDPPNRGVLVASVEARMISLRTAWVDIA